MAVNGKSITLKKSELNKLRKVQQMHGYVKYLTGKGIQYTSLTNQLRTGRVSEKSYTRLKTAGLI